MSAAASDTLVIFNPAARSTRAGNHTESIGRLSGSPHIVTTTRKGEARHVAAEAASKGFKRVVAAGGDGTINEVVNGLAGTGVTLGVLPIGTMNVFATELGLPTNLRDAWKVIRAGQTREIDLARANRQYFVQLAGIGLDAQAVQETSQTMKNNLGPLSYVISAAQVAARKPPRLVVQTEEEEVAGTFVLIGNGRFYGGRLAFFQRARVDDGQLDVLVFQRMGYIDIARYITGVLMGNHTRMEDVVYLQTRKLTVTCDEPVPVEVDGEVVGELPFTFRVSSRKLRVLVP